MACFRTWWCGYRSSWNCAYCMLQRSAACSSTKRSRSAYFLYTLLFIWMVIMTWTTLFSLWNMARWFSNKIHTKVWTENRDALLPLTTFAPHIIKVHRYVVHFWLKPTPFSRVILDHLQVIGSLVSRNSLSCMESKCLLHCSQEAIIFPSPKSDKSSPCPLMLFL